MTPEAMAAEFERRAEARDLVIGIIGLGYVGLPLTEGFLNKGFRVLAYEPDPSKVAAIQAGRTYINHIPDARVAAMRDSGRLEVTSDPDRLSVPDTLLMCVPTPLDHDRQPDLSFVRSCTETLATRLRPGQLVVLESTTYPGTTDEELRPRLTSRGFTIGQDIFLVFSPEREDPGNRDYATRTIPKVCGGDTEACLQAGIALYSQAIDRVVPVS